MSKSLLRNNSQSPITLPAPYTGIIAPGDAVVLDDPPSVVAEVIGIVPELITFLTVTQVPDAQPVDGHDRGAAAAGIAGALASLDEPLDINGQRIVNLADPVDQQDAATKQYVDLHAGGGSGTVQQVNSGTGLTGGPILVTGTLSADFGTSAGKVTEGNDSRLSPAPSVAGAVVYDTGTAYTKTPAGATGQVLKVGAGGLPEWAADSTSPTGDAGGSLAGTYPNPTIKAGVITNTEVSATAAIETSKLSGALTDVVNNGLEEFVDAATKIARTYYVAVGGMDSPTSGGVSNPFATIQAAHDAAAADYSAGEYVAIEVGPGTFTGNVNITRKNTLIQGAGHRAEMFATTIAGSITVNPSSATLKFNDLVGVAGCFVSVPASSTAPAIKATGSGAYSLIVNDCYLYTNNAASTASAVACDGTNPQRPRVLLNDCIVATEQGGPAIMQLDRGDARCNNTQIRHNSSVVLGSAGPGINVLNDASLWLNSCTVDTRSAGAAIVATGASAAIKLLLTTASVTTVYAGAENTTHGITVSNTLAAAAYLWQASFSVADVSAGVYAVNGSGPFVVVYGELSFAPGTNTSIAPALAMTPLVEMHGTMNLPSLSAALPLKLDANKTVTAAAVALDGSEVSGTLPIGKGGTGLSTGPTAGGVVYGGATTLGYTAVGTSGQPLISAGTSAPSFGQLNLGVSDNVTGTLPKGNQESQDVGGDLTGSTATATVTALRGNPVKAGTLGAGDAGKVLTWSGSEYEPATITPGGGGSGGSGLTYYLNYGVAGEAPLPVVDTKELSLLFSDPAANTPAVTAPDGGNYAPLADFVTAVDEPGATTVPPGIWDVVAYLLSSHVDGVFFRFTVHKWDGVTLSAAIATSADVELTSTSGTPVPYTAEVYVPQIVLSATERVVIRLAVTRTTAAAHTVTGYFGNGHPSHSHTTIGAPGGTGLVKVVDGIIQAPATLLFNADVDDAAAIVVSKLDGNAESGTANKVLHGSNTAAGPAVWGAVALGSDVSGQLPVANGGTGLESGTSGGVPYFNNTNTMASSGVLTQHALMMGGGAGAAPKTLNALGTTTTVLHGNASGEPSFGQVSLTADVTGTLPVLNGGTNGSATPAAGEVAYGTGSAYAFTSGSTSGKLLKSNGLEPPTWLDIVPYTAGGTGTNTIGTANQVPYVNAGQTGLTYTSGGAQGEVLGIGASGNPEWMSNGSSPTGAAGNDLSGNYPDPTVAKINGTSVTAGGSLATGAVLRATGGASAAWGTIDLGSANAVSGTLAKAYLPSETVYTDGSYDNPAWITNLAGSKISGDISGNAANVTGVVGALNGGTGQSTWSKGDLLYASATNTLSKLAIPAGAQTVGQVLVKSATDLPSWSDTLGATGTNLTWASRDVGSIVAVTNVSASTTLTVTSPIIRIFSTLPAADVLFTSTPTIAAPPINGTRVTVINTTSYNVTFQDESVLPGSTIQLGGVTQRTLGAYQSIDFVHSNGFWIERAVGGSGVVQSVGVQATTPANALVSVDSTVAAIPKIGIRGLTGDNPGNAGALPYFSDAKTLASMAAGTSGQYLRSKGTAAPDWADVPYDVAGMVAGKPPANGTVFYFKATRAFTLSSTSGDHVFTANTQSDASRAFTVTRTRGGTTVTILTATFAASGTVASISAVANTDIAVGDIIKVVAPDPQDATLADVYWTLTGKL